VTRWRFSGGGSTYYSTWQLRGSGEGGDVEGCRWAVREVGARSGVGASAKIFICCEGAEG